MQRSQYDIGQRTLLDLLDTENEYFQAKRSYANAEYDIQNAYARLFAAQGQLVSKIGSVRSGLPEVNRETYADAATICQAVAPVQITVDKDALLANAKPLTLVNQQLIKPAEKPVEKIALSDKVVPDVQFESNSAKIKPESYPVLDNAYNTLVEWGNSKVEVAGHTDKRNTSTADYNYDLSQRRAQAVSDYLIKKGIDPSRMTVKGYGFDQPIAENDPVHGNAANRRVELIRQK